MTIFDAEELIRLRRDLHAHPELSHNESRTAAVVASALRSLGLEPRIGVGGHGVVADIIGPVDGPTLLYRADMDALPIQEISGRTYGSTNPGVMHACGHDVHTTIGLGVASRLVAQRNDIRGRVRLMFQPAEEAAPPPGRAIGAEAMVEQGLLDGPRVDAAFALHVMPTLPVGTIGFTGGPVWAASELFDIHLRGGMAHGAYPHEGRDTLYVAAQLIQALQMIPARNVDTRELCVISFGRIAAGTAYNIMPDHVHLQGLIRTHNPAVRARVLQRFHEVVQGIASAGECSAQVDMVVGTHRTANDPWLERFCVDRLALTGLVKPVPAQPQMGAEDFAAVSRRVPSAYLLLGVRNEERGIVHMIHTPEFDVDEACLAGGADAMTDVILHAGHSWDTVAPNLGGGQA
jgi:amidohydrolase